MIRYVTTFSPESYEQYARKMLEGVVRFWPEGEILAFYEEMPAIKVPGVTYLPLLEIQGLNEFLEDTKSIDLFYGNLPELGYNYKYDIRKFCRKMFAQLEASKGYPGILIWLDADTMTVQDIPLGWIEGWIENSAIAYMGRNDWHLCASFIIWDCLRKETKHFFDTYSKILLNRTFIFLREWHDSYIVEEIVRGIGIPSTNISAEDKRNGPVNIYDTVFQGRSFHLKGNLKYKPRRYEQLIDIVKEKQPARILEIGTWKGLRAIEMKLASPNSEYVGIDLFEDGSDEIDEIENNVKPRVSRREVAKSLAENAFQCGGFRLLKGFSSDQLEVVLSEYGEDSFDLIFIDGGHSVETIRNDFEQSIRLLRKNGAIVLDDYYTGGIDVDRWGCNRIVDGIQATLLPIEDRVKGGGFVQMVVVNHGDLKWKKSGG